MYFFLIVDAEGTPGKLVGPVEWERAVELLTSFVEKALAEEGKELSQEDRDAIDMDGTYSFANDHGGAYIVMSESDDDDGDDGDGDEEKTVSIVIADRDSSATVQDTAHFSSWKQLKDDVELLVKDAPFRKVSVDLTASWDTSQEDEDMLREIELG